MIKKYDLGSDGRKFLLGALKDGLELSSALLTFLGRTRGQTFTLLPEGLPRSIVEEPDKSFEPKYGPGGRTVYDHHILEGYNSIEIFLTYIRDRTNTQPDAFLWGENYLAKRGDPILSKPTSFDADVKRIFVGETVTSIVRAKALFAGDGSQLVKSIRSLSVWNGILLRKFSVESTNGIMTHNQVEASLRDTLTIFAMAYKMEGFIFFEPFSEQP